MAKAKVRTALVIKKKKVKTITLELTESEAKYLKDILQNFISLDDEDETAYSEMNRGKIFNALKTILKR